jgi:AraC-like DNA-binding protein
MAFFERLVCHGLRATESTSNDLPDLIGSYTASTNVAAFWTNHGISGMLFWGKPDESDIEALNAALTARNRPWRSQTWLVDLSRLEVLDLRMFDKLSSSVTSYLSASNGGITRQAVVRPYGMAGVVVTEFFAKAAGAIPVCSFADTRAALEWIGVPDSGLLEQLERIRASQYDAKWLTTELRSYLDRGAGGSVKDVARQMAISPRTMQRRLLKLGTNFQQEVAQARLRLAKKLMRTTRRSLKSIAFDAGYASPQHFSAAFRQQVGVAPSRWRDEFIE